MNRYSVGWFLTFIGLIVTVFVAARYFTGYEAIGAAARMLWNAMALVANGAMRLFGSLVLLLARGVSWRRFSRLAALLTGLDWGTPAASS